MWAAAALWAADGTVGADIPRRPVRMTSIVRSDPRTGKLVRSVVVRPKAAAGQRIGGAGAASPGASTAEPTDSAIATPPPANLQRVVERIAGQQGLPTELLHSVIKVESNYNPYAVSSKGALGMMQLIPSTARRFGVADVFDPVENIQGGARYLKFLLDLFNGDYRLALAAYNAGENAVARYGDVPPYAETQNYVKLVARHLQQAQKPAAGKASEPRETKPLERAADGNHLQEVVEPDGTVHYVTR